MKRSISLLAFVVLLWLFCSDYNPFEKSSNVNIVILEQNSSLCSDSIISIFTTETLTVAATVRENIDSFTITVNNNRYWTDTTVLAPISPDNYTFLFSFVNTGYKEVTLTTYRTNGDIIPQNFSVYVSSPLAQVDIAGEEKDTAYLSTAPVGDNDIFYNWSFDKGIGNPLVVSWSLPNYAWKIAIVGAGTGYLRVSDSLGNVSPAATFLYNFIDTTGPRIFCINKGVIGDTVITGASSFIFKVECDDGIGIGGALVNNTPFDDYVTNVDYNIYYKRLDGMDTISGAFTAIVEAWDNGNNTNDETFYIKYDINGPKEIIIIKYPPQNPYITDQASYDIIATIYNSSDDSVVVAVQHIEKSIYLYLDTLSGNAEEDVMYTASLKTGSNTIVIYVLDMDSLATTLAKDTVGLTYSTVIIEDTTAPYINSLTVNGIDGKEHYIAGDYAFLELEAFDEHMESVVINGKLKVEDEKYLWRDTLALSGGAQSFILHLTDASGNRTDDTVWVQKNHLPAISPPVSLPQTLIIGKSWQTNFTVSDADNDPVGVTHRPGVNGELPEAGTVTITQLTAKLWSVNWSGTVINDSAKKQYRTEIVLSDDKQNTIYPWNFSIKDSADAVSYIFTFDLPDGIDTTEDGAVDLSQIIDTVIINCHLKGDAKPLQENDTIAIIQESQTLKFAAASGDFDMIFAPLYKTGTKNIKIMVIDSFGIETIVDTLTIIYSVDFPDYIDSLGWFLRSDSGIKVEEDRVIEWLGMSIKLRLNEYTNDIYEMETMPGYSPDVIQGYPALHFIPKEHSNLLNTSEHWMKGPFTLFFVTRQALATENDSGNVLISAGASQYIGLGVFDGKIGITAKTNPDLINNDTTITCNLKVKRDQWHIICFSSEYGFSSGSTPNILKMWLNGYACPNDSIIFPNIGGLEGINYLILGGGSKHYAYKNWNGDMAEIVKYSQYLDENERNAVARYLASKYKIRLHK